MMSTQKQTSTEHWSNYWRSGALTSLPCDFSRNYDGELAEFWSKILNTLPQTAQILDLCTGNLALPLLLSELNETTGKALSFTAVDQAKFSWSNVLKTYPEFKKYQSQIEVKDGFDAHNSAQFGTHSQDLITSQYGVEYTDTKRLAPIIFNLLKPGGQFVMLAHATDTDILKYMQNECQVYEYLQQNQLVISLYEFATGCNTAAAFLRHSKQLNVPSQTGLFASDNQLLLTFYRAITALAQMSVKELIQQRQSILSFFNEHMQARERMKDLLAVNLKIQNDPNWFTCFEHAGLALLETQTIKYQNRHNAGTAYCFVKPNAADLVES